MWHSWSVVGTIYWKAKAQSVYPTPAFCHCYCCCCLNNAAAIFGICKCGYFLFVTFFAILFRLRVGHFFFILSICAQCFGHVYSFSLSFLFFFFFDIFVCLHCQLCITFFCYFLHCCCFFVIADAKREQITISRDNFGMWIDFSAMSLLTSHCSSRSTNITIQNKTKR